MGGKLLILYIKCRLCDYKSKYYKKTKKKLNVKNFNESGTKNLNITNIKVKENVLITFRIRTKKSKPIGHRPFVSMKISAKSIKINFRNIL